MSSSATTSRVSSLLRHMLHHPHPLPYIESCSISLSRSGPNQSSFRHFVANLLPSLRYHNPHLQVHCTIVKQVVPPTITLKKGTYTHIQNARCEIGREQNQDVKSKRQNVLLLLVS